MRKLLIKVNEKTGKVNLLLILSEINLSFTDREGKQKKQKSVKKYPTVQSILYFYWTSEKSKYEKRGRKNGQKTISQTQKNLCFISSPGENVQSFDTFTFLLLFYLYNSV
jgi:hypothetical protein